MFLWMFIEGLYLHNVVTVTVFQGKFPHLFYAALGWGAPVIMTVNIFFLKISPLKVLIKKYSASDDMGWFYSHFTIKSEMLVWI